MEQELKESEGLMGEIATYGFRGGGKLLRPLVFLLALGALGEGVPSDERVRISLIFEMVHLASLLHDDIVDGSSTRRGRRAAHLAFGVPETVLAGDFLAGSAGKLAVGTGSIEFVRSLQDSLLDLARGELQELKVRWDVSLSEEAYYDIIRNKTGSIFLAAARGAATLVGAGEALVAPLEEFSINYGFGFQIVDDILDYQADPQKLGKPVLQDLTEGRVTLPFILAKRGLSPDEARRLDRFGSEGGVGPGDLPKVLELVERGGGIAKAREAAKGYLDRAIASISALPGGKSLADLARDSLGRTH
jgi:octaprenyl-diphosphate synthase